MSEALRISGRKARLALVGVAAMMLGGCADANRFGDPFADPFKSSASLDRNPTGTVNQPQPQQQASNFFTEAFRPFDDQPAPPPARAPEISRPAYPQTRPIAVESQPLAPPHVAAAPAATFTPAAPAAPVSIVRAAPNSVGGWTSEGGVPVVVGQGENAGMIATRYGVPTTTLLALNGYNAGSAVPPGARLVIPVYHATGSARAAVAAAPAAVAPRPAQTARLEAPRAPAVPRQAQAVLTAPKPDPATALAEKRAHLAQAKAEEAARKVAAAKAAGDRAQAMKLAEQARAAKLASAKAEAAKQAASKLAAAKTAPAKMAVEKTAQAQVQAQVPAPAVAAAKPAAIQKAQVIAGAAPVAPPATVQAVAKVAAPAAETTASLPSPATNVAANESANPEFRWPARGRVIQSFGAGGNDGINIAVPEGTQVKAAEGGVVAYAGSELKGYGNLVLIRHPNGFVSAYANNGSINVKRGENVKRGQTIALSGQTGNVASPQLHFELRKGQKPVDPSNYLAGL